MLQLLNEHTDHEVHLFEADSRPGGHANTVTYSRPNREPVDVDTYVQASLVWRHKGQIID